jgi:hypothetical protein
LFWLDTGSKLLDLLEQVKDHLFVSEQIVSEVLRNKVGSFQKFTSLRLKEIQKEKADSPIPGHLFGLNEEESAELKKRFTQATEARNRLKKLADEALERIHQSEDTVSKRLSGVFATAISPTDEEMRRARNRKEIGNPPGKSRDRLGDQISWEQFLSHCDRKGIKRVWIVTGDSDFYDKAGDRCLLNPLLARDLNRLGVSESHCFDKLTGVEDFARNSGVKVEKLPTEQESEEIKKEIESLPPIGWLNTANEIPVGLW